MNYALSINAVSKRFPSGLIYIVGCMWAAWLFYLGLTGGLGVEPVNALERAYGEIALQLLVAGLCITPLRRIFGINFLKHRRALGLTAFFFVFAHFSVWAFIDIQDLSAVWADILKRPYVTIGMAASVLMLPLAVTSNDLSIRRLGGAWRKLHKLTYAVCLLGALHFIWLIKGFQMEPFLYAVAILILLGLRNAKIANRLRNLHANYPQG